ncbi:MAG TPA: flagellar basal body rod protein FlgC [Bacillales bacterium]|nr:flagellar basal body rod protein FlgC [Bacillales bacterium]
MSIFHSINTSASALTAQRLRMDVISANLANVNTTRAQRVDGEWQPYRRKMVVMEPIQKGKFDSYLQEAASRSTNPGGGVKVTDIVEDQSPFKMVYRPNHPDADEDGYVRMPNVNPLKEMVDLIGATRSYEANVTALNASKGMLMKALQIGR